MSGGAVFPGSVIQEQPRNYATEFSDSRKGVSWHSKQTQWANPPPGLEYFSEVDQLVIKQQIDALEVVFSYERKNRYEISNGRGERIYLATERSACMTRYCCGPAREFEMKISDNKGNEVIRLERPLACGSPCCCCFPKSVQKIQVNSPAGECIGSVEQHWRFFNCISSDYSVKNEKEEVLFIIQGPSCINWCSTVDFTVRNPESFEEIGKISKLWRGCCTEMFTDASNFSVTFPVNLDVRSKILLMSAAFLIDYMFFEKKK